MKFPKMPKLPKWGWVVLVLVAVWYIFLREGFSPKRPGGARMAMEPPKGAAAAFAATKQKTA